MAINFEKQNVLTLATYTYINIINTYKDTVSLEISLLWVPHAQLKKNVITFYQKWFISVKIYTRISIFSRLCYFHCIRRMGVWMHHNANGYKRLRQKLINNRHLFMFSELSGEKVGAKRGSKSPWPPPTFSNNLKRHRRDRKSNSNELTFLLFT